MSRINQNLEITKDYFSELYFKVFIYYQNNERIEKATCVLHQDSNIIKEVSPIVIQEDGIYFKLGNDIPRGNYKYTVIATINGETITLLDNREVNVI